MIALRSCRATPRWYCHWAAHKNAAISTSAVKVFSSEFFSRILELLNSSRPLLQYCRPWYHRLATSISYNDSDIGQSHGTQQREPTKWAGQYDGENETRGTNHHRNKITTLSRRLVSRKPFRRASDVVDVILISHNATVG